jgi:hypothetical protein
MPLPGVSVAGRALLLVAVATLATCEGESTLDDADSTKCASAYCGQCVEAYGRVGYRNGDGNSYMTGLEHAVQMSGGHLDPHDYATIKNACPYDDSGDVTKDCRDMGPDVGCEGGWVCGYCYKNVCIEAWQISECDPAPGRDP